MFIVPISNTISPVESFFDKDVPVSEEKERSPQFSDVFREVFKDVQETQRQSQEDSIRIIQGDIDNLHEIYNNMTKAAVAVEAFVSVKNASVDAYNQILQITM